MNKSGITLIVQRLILASMIWCGLVQADFNREYQLKAAYLLNFARFIYWPDQVIESRDYFNICVIGDSPFEESLDRLSNKKIKNKKIKIKYSQDFERENYCHIVYISDGNKNKYREIINKINGEPILTVSDIDDFANYGGMIGFIRVKNKIKFEINVEKSTKSNIKYRSQLLEVAEKLR
ncbi:MAG: DUF4154 domain-containing protein [endosymbiont of Galathealinum brachiosum]|uniref:DUF4154 domain-containing protein n=1 Tax=endosymbiont of Galathealinum brachiosum TaxID=2200906 RepID=A0A370DD95_9GAMM|nr:MAG: DUF4154 domain-containing protein [endosymbiont of Galathealinum brachiosum]